MLIDARSIRDGAQIEADVCIVGAGAAGITIARELRARPMRVALLESGWLAPDDVTRSLYAGEVRGQPYFPLDAARERYFGGTTNVWAGECRPLDTLDFERRDWVPDSGWPFGLDHLVPFYERAQVLCEVGPFAYTADAWRATGVRPLPFREGRVLSHAFQYSPPTRFGEAYRDEIARSGSVAAYLGANAVDLETGTPPTSVSRVRVACLSGSGFTVKARLFVLAMGGIENARLLLLANRVQPSGLGNTHGLVGRYFMEHLYLDRAALVLARADGIDPFYTRGRATVTASGQSRRVRGIFGLSPDLQRREGLTNYCAVLEGERLRATALHCGPLLGAVLLRSPRRRAVRQLLRTAGLVASAVAARRGRGGGRLPAHLFRVKNVMEQAPNPDSRVVLGEETDRLGCRRVVLCWRLSAIDKRTAHRGHEILDEELRHAGIGRLESSLGRPRDPWPPGLRGARHHIGTTRMHVDPRRGVVDGDGRVHGIANLYVAGSSVFPTSGAANPTLTIVALALRLADHVKRCLG